MNQPTLKVGSLFAGVGGICEAFRLAGCKVVWANEIDPHSRKTYQLNHKETKLTEESDIRRISAADVEPVDIITAGFPCQPFSQAGSARGFQDERGHLFFEVTRLLNELKPKAYFLENVKTLATHDKGKTFREIRKGIAKTNYSFIPFILKASEYTNIPQGRERVYIVGFRDEAEVSYEKPVKTNEDFKCLAGSVSSQFEVPTKMLSAPKAISDFLDPSSVEESDYYNQPENKIHKRVRDAVTHPQTVYQYRRWFVRENKSNVCPTLTANMGLGGHNIPIILDGVTPRRLTPKECFNLQGFRSDFLLPEDVAKVHLYRQSGNSVVVPLVERIAREMVRVLNENRNR